MAMKKLFIALFLTLLLCGCTPAPLAVDDSIETKIGTVVDRAMDNGFPYIGIVFEEGSGNCFYSLEKGSISDSISIGDKVEITYGLDERTHYWFIIELQEIG